MTLEETALFSKLTVRTFTVDPPETALCPDSKPLDFDISACYRVSFRVKYALMCHRFDGLYSVSYHFTDGGETQFSY